ncbi:hypothetical protein IT575_08085 [bacterium]|nr:hypothetical protein [bacterium]
MLDWFKKKPQKLESLNDDALRWSVARLSDPTGDCMVRYLGDKSLAGHPELPWRFGVAIEHRFEDQQRDILDPLYDQIEDRLMELLALPPRRGLLTLVLRDQRMVEWISYCRSDADAQAVLEGLKDFFGNGLTAMGADDPKWEVFRQFTPR